MGVIRDWSLQDYTRFLEKGQNGEKCFTNEKKPFAYWLDSFLLITRDAFGGEYPLMIRNLTRIGLERYAGLDRLVVAENYDQGVAQLKLMRITKGI